MLRSNGLLGQEDVRLSVMGHRGSVLDGIGGRFALRQPLTGWLSVNGSYALFRDRYAGPGSAVWRHSVAAGAELLLARRWYLGWDVRALLSEEEQLLQLLATLRYHL